MSNLILSALVAMYVGSCNEIPSNVYLSEAQKEVNKIETINIPKKQLKKAAKKAKKDFKYYYKQKKNEINKLIA